MAVFRLPREEAIGIELQWLGPYLGIAMNPHGGYTDHVTSWDEVSGLEGNVKETLNGCRYSIWVGREKGRRKGS